MYYDPSWEANSPKEIQKLPTFIAEMFTAIFTKVQMKNVYIV
jgi:hypothetical protein